MLTLIAALLCTAAAPERLGLYPLALPDGRTELADRIAAQLHEGAADLPGVRAFDLVAHSSCAPDEGPCLAAAARRAGLDAMLSAAIEATAHGYLWHLREFAAADGELLHEARGETNGGPLDLGGDLERGVCVVSGAATCEGELSIGGALDVHLFVDGTDRGPPPLSARLAVGRHSVKLGADERRVRISYARTARLFAGLRAGAPALLEREDPPALALAAAPQANVIEARSEAARILFGGGLALLAGAAGTSLYATSASDAHGAAGVASILALTGAAALAGAGLVVALTPSGAAVSGSF
jgi:hypothetical protein